MAYTTIKKPSSYFNTKLYTGDGTTSNAITGVGFQPDLVWLKNRSTIAGHHLADVVRGKSGTNYLSLSTDTTAAEAAQGDDDGVNTIGSDGFTVGYTNSTAWNNSGNNYASWNWLAGGTGVSNTDGSITSTVSANTTSGFSIVSFTGTGANATVGHGLGTSDIGAIIVKNRDSGTDNWWVYNKGLGATSGLRLNLTNGKTVASTLWNDTAPTSTVFSVGTGSGVNASGQNLIAYVFAEKKGYSKFGVYDGNGNADGPFIYTGFKPAFLIIKCHTLGTDNWYIHDNKRSTYNVTNNLLFPNISDAESTNNPNASYDFLSNGFKARDSYAGSNASGDSYIYMAFAEEPLVGDNPATAR